MAKNTKDLAYYLTLFKIEGHTTYRAHFGSDKGGFDRERAQWVVNPPTLTERRVYRFDRITGEIKVEN